LQRLARQFPSIAAVKKLPILLLCLVLGAAGCGDDDSPNGSPSNGSPSNGSPSNGSPSNGSSPNASSSAQSPTEAAKRSKPQVSVPSGPPPTELAKEDLIEGTGPSAKAGDQVTVQYVGVGFDSGKEFDASWDRGEPFSFKLGAGEVIPGWDQGVVGMKAGGQRQLVIPADLAYGEAGFPPGIAPNETLVFAVDLLDVK
jgi:peptidylprolyl isomerase